MSRRVSKENTVPVESPQSADASRPANKTAEASPSHTRSISFASRFRSGLGTLLSKTPNEQHQRLSMESKTIAEEGDNSIEKSLAKDCTTENRSDDLQYGQRELKSRELRTLGRRRTTLNVDRAEPELHIIGQISAFSGNLENAFCSFKIESGSCWENVAEKDYSEGQSQVDYGSQGLVVWNHPIEAHFFCSTIQGWPRILFEVYALDRYGGKQHHGYSICCIPTLVGHHDIECSVWRPTGNPTEEVSSFFLGINPQLNNLDLLYSKAQDERCKIFTVSVGTIHLELDIMMRNFEYHDISWT